MKSLNKDQLEAVKSNSNYTLVVAGPGTGKTTVIMHRILSLIQDENINPKNILVLTFSSQAATEIKERLSSNVIFNTDANRETWIGTFHSIALRILKKSLKYIDNDFKIAGEEIAIKIFIDANKSFKTSEKLKSIFSIVQILKENFYELKTLDNICENNLKNMIVNYGIYEEISKEDIITCYTNYQESLRKQGYVDFCDLLMKLKYLFSNNESVLRYYQNLFSHIIVDEYQDTNYAQYVLLRILLQNGINSLFCVGDDDQNIYSWRGARIKNMLNFQNEFPNANIIKLNINYRSSKEILAHSQSLIAKNQNRYTKNILAHPNQSKYNGYLKIVQLENHREECLFIIDKVKEKILEGSNTIAILVRHSFQMPIIEYELKMSNISYNILGGVSFIEKNNIKKIMMCFKNAINPRNNLELLQNMHMHGFMNFQAYQSILEMYDSEGESAYDMILKNKAFDLYQYLKYKGNLTKILHFVSNVKIWNEMYRLNDEPKEILKRIIYDMGYIEKISHGKFISLSQVDFENLYLLSDTELESFDEILTFLDIASKYDLLDEFIESITSDFRKKKKLEARITLSTIHSAKGMEFDFVFIPGVEDGILPHFKYMGKKGFQKEVIFGSENVLQNKIEEERRLMYVAMTRAKKNLYISHVNKRFFHGLNIYLEASRFIDEIKIN